MSSDGERIAAALRRSPVYVDPAYGRALPTADRDRLVRRIHKSPTPIYVVLVPIVAGSTWQSSDQVTTVVQSHLGRDGTYVTLSGDFGDVFDVEMFGGTDEQRRSANLAGYAVSYEKAYEKAPLGARLERCVELIATGKGREAYEKAQNDVGTGRPSPRPTPKAHAKGGDGLLIGVPVAVAAVLAAGGALVWLRRRRERATIERLRLPRTVFSTALKAGEDELRTRAEQELIAFGESLDGDQRALDAYAAAGHTLDHARSAADLAGVIVLVHQGRAGKDATPLCYFDPRHGEGAIAVKWRAPGTRDSRTVRVCAACAKAVRDRSAPDVLLDDGRPYYEGATLWAETGYGQFGDLVGRIRDE